MLGGFCGVFIVAFRDAGSDKAYFADLICAKRFCVAGLEDEEFVACAVSRAVPRHICIYVAVCQMFCCEIVKQTFFYYFYALVL